jgi:RNA polymerase sigma-70 factor (ECF subfamily)
MFHNLAVIGQTGAWRLRATGKIVTEKAQEPAQGTGEQLADYIKAVAVNRDRGSFDHLFRLMAPRIKAYCLKRGSNAAAAEEMAQETMIQVWRRAAQFDPTKASATTWIFSIARNKRIDHFRKEQRPAITAEDLLQGMPDPVGADEKMEISEVEEILTENMQDLSDEQADVIHKAFFEDKTHQVIARELDLPLGTVKSRIRLALQKLRISMAEYEG